MKNILTITFILICILKTNAQTLKDCATCSTKIIKTEQINDLSIDEIRYLTNDLFARKGYKFKSSDVDNYYSDKVWYKPVSDNDKIIFNEIEKKNIKLFQDKTTEIKKDREKLIVELKSFKSALISKSVAELNTKYGFPMNIQSYPEQYKYLIEAISKINLDDINWSFNIGMYKLIVDNGYVVTNYEIRISRDGFWIQNGCQGASEISKELYPNDWITEFSFWWKFEWKNNKIKFLKMDMAG